MEKTMNMKKKNIVALATVCAIALIIGCSNGSDSSNEPTPIAVDSVTLYPSTLTLEPDKSYVLSASVTPWNADDRTVTWSSSNYDVVGVSYDGTVTANREGVATITAKAGGKNATCLVTVTRQTVSVQYITLDITTLALTSGEKRKLNATVIPENADEKTVSWTSSDTSIVTVDSDGTVTAVKAGLANITAKAGGKEAKCEVAVNNSQSGTTQGGTTHVHNYSGGLCTVCGFQKPFMVDATIDDSGVLTDYRGSEAFVDIPDGVTGIGNNAFEGCEELTIVNIPSSVTAIGSCAFKKCKELKAVVISEGVTSIGSYAFEDCSTLTIMARPNAGTVYEGSVTIPSSVTKIGGSAFSGCYDITNVTIPRGVTIIGEYLFSGCKNLTSVRYNGTKEEWNAVIKGSDWDWNTGNYTITCTDGTISKN